MPLLSEGMGDDGNKGKRLEISHCGKFVISNIAQYTCLAIVVTTYFYKKNNIN
jgi:hypothetical protein